MIDILLDSEGGLKLKSNDLTKGFSDQQNINDILEANKGEYKRNPQIGLNAINFINGATTAADIRVQAKLQLELDGFRVKDIQIIKEGRDLTIVPYAER